MGKSLVLGAVVVVVLTGGVLLAGDWPQFNGPTRNGISPQKNIARQWPDAGPRVLWSAQLGLGFGGASVHGKEVFLLDRHPDATHDVLRCFNFDTGEEIWRHAYETRGRLDFEGSRSTPTVTDTHVFTVGAFGHIHCFDRATHAVVWSKHMKDFDAETPRWGFSQSPLLIGDLVILAPMSSTAGMIALKQADGDIAWKAEPIGGDTYASPTLMTLHEVEQIVLLTKTTLAAVEPATGKTLWKYTGYKNAIPIPNPTPIGDNRLFVTGGYNGGSAVLQVKRQGDAWSVDEIARIADGSQIHNALLYEGHLYANLNTNENIGRKSPPGLACLDLNGKVIWKTDEKPAIDRGNLIIADNMIVSLAGQDGTLRLIEATPAGYKEIAAAKMFAKPGTNLWAPLALAEGRLLLRNQHELKCIDLVNP